jgi:hypothetical protein
MSENQNESDDWEIVKKDLEEGLIETILALRPALDDFLDVAGKWEDERSNNPEFVVLDTSHRAINIAIYLAEKMEEVLLAVYPDDDWESEGNESESEDD